MHNTWFSISSSPIGVAVEHRVPVVMTLHNYRLGCLSTDLFRDGQICTACVGRAPWAGVRHGCYRGSRALSALQAVEVVTNRRRRVLIDGVTTFVAPSDFMAARLVDIGVPSRTSRRQAAFHRRSGRTGDGRHPSRTRSSSSADSRRARAPKRCSMPGPDSRHVPAAETVRSRAGRHRRRPAPRIAARGRARVGALRRLAEPRAGARAIAPFAGVAVPVGVVRTVRHGADRSAERRSADRHARTPRPRPRSPGRPTNWSCRQETPPPCRPPSGA